MVAIGTKDRKAKEKERRRNDIIDAAEKVFFSKGYDSATMDDVAKEAEFSKRTVYVYFNSKEQIYFEIMLRGYRLLTDMLAATSQARYNSAIDRIQQIGNTLLDFSTKYPKYFEAIMEYENGELDFDKGITDQSREDCYKQGEKVMRYLIDALNEGIEQGVIRSSINTVSTALVLWACVIGVFKTVKKKNKYIEHYHHRSPDQFIAEAFDLLTRSIRSIRSEDIEK
ncbi:TetR/AcrR family transcriptional regulator [Paenibacillus sp. DMB20]|uniref:TetR/AcrR family transcriptional regulator n=1 Tax=Paenibacillus sp. DMB20 TaxID=1642570 RepID=UPI000AFA0D41|nr:TetR/AcrR family transcriptional regulator [Paenibacillus sp. DMB20]